MTTDIYIEATNLSFSYKRPLVSALESVSFSIPSGNFTAIMGPNGSGKSTLIRLILGLLQPDSGDLTVFGKRPWEDPEEIQVHIGYVPQREYVNNRLPLIVSEVVLQGLIVRMGGAISQDELRNRLDVVLEMMGIADLAHRPYNALSGGEQQRALIARALAVDPEILLLDEPFSAVDVASQDGISKLLNELANENNITVLAAVHNVNILVHYLDSILLLNHRLIAYDSPDAVLTPEILREAYGVDIPVLICEEGFRHPVMEDTHGRTG